MCRRPARMPAGLDRVQNYVFVELLIFHTPVTVDVTELRPQANKLNKYLMRKL